MLLEIASVVRDASAQTRKSHAPTSYKREDDDFYSAAFRTLARRQFSDARLSLTDQVAKSIFIRRQRLLWHRSHVAKLSFPRPNLDDTLSSGQMPVGRSSPAQQLSATPVLHDHSKSNRQIRAVGPVPSSTNLSRPRGPISVLQGRKAPTVVSGITRSAVVSDKLVFTYPEPPTTTDDNELVSCPYCEKPLPRLPTQTIFSETSTLLTSICIGFPKRPRQQCEGQKHPST